MMMGRTRELYQAAKKITNKKRRQVAAVKKKMLDLKDGLNTLRRSTSQGSSNEPN